MQTSSMRRERRANSSMKGGGGTTVAPSERAGPVMTWRSRPGWKEWYWRRKSSKKPAAADSSTPETRLRRPKTVTRDRAPAPAIPTNPEGLRTKLERPTASQ
ncbi:hypothetical protein NL676_027806 [Syzygium grande]|nr:hypothetical protein NL676_027806 [Syzygium grande]